MRARWMMAVLTTVVLAGCTSNVPSEPSTSAAALPPVTVFETDWGTTSSPVPTTSASTPTPPAPTTTGADGPELAAATVAWFTADCTAQAELRGLSLVSSGTTVEQQLLAVEKTYQQFADLGRSASQTLDALAPPQVPGGPGIKAFRVSTFQTIEREYTAGLAAVTAAAPTTSEDLLAAVEAVEVTVNSAIAALPQPTALPAELAARIAALPACQPSPPSAPTTSTVPTT